MLPERWQQGRKKLTKFIWAKVETVQSGSYPLIHKMWYFIFCVMYLFVLYMCVFLLPQSNYMFLRSEKEFHRTH